MTRRLRLSKGDNGTLRSSYVLHGSLAHATSKAKLPHALTKCTTSVDVNIDGCVVASCEACSLHLTLVVRYTSAHNTTGRSEGAEQRLAVMVCEDE